jgi:hypothetical protein
MPDTPKPSDRLPEKAPPEQVPDDKLSESGRAR